MTTSKTKLRSLTRVRLCDARTFQRVVLIPELFIFVLLMVLGTFLGQDLLSNVSRLVALVYLLVVNISVQSYLKEISARLLVYHVCALVALVALLGFFLSQEVVFGMFLPAALVILCLLLVPMRWEIAAWTSLPVLGLLFFFSVIAYISQRAPISAISHGLVLSIAASLASVLRAALFVRTSENSFEARTLVDPELYTSSDAQKSLAQAPVDVQIREEARIILADEIRSELLWRLPAMLAVYGSLVAGLVINITGFEPVVLVYMFLLIALDVIVVRRLLNSRSVREFYVATSAVVCAAMLWWIYLLTMHVHDNFAYDFAFALFVLLFVSTPWQPVVNCSLSALCLVIAGLRLSYHHDALTFGIILVALAVATRSSAIAYHGITARATLLYLRRCIESGVSTLLCVRLLAERILHLLGAPQLLLVTGDRTAEIITLREEPNKREEDIYVRALIEKARAQHSEEGVLNVADLGAQFKPVLYDWFAALPRRIAFVRFAAVLEEREQDLVVFCPLTSFTRIVGFPRVFRSLLGLAAIVRGTLAAARSRFQTSDVLLSTQRLLSQRDEEVGNMVHLVNNVAQDIAIQCDTLERQHPGAVPAELRAIDNLARNLSTGVSDLKLLRELGRLREASRFEDVPVDAVLRELQSLGDYRRLRRDEVFIFDTDVPPTIAVRVTSREFLETALRTFLRLSSSRLDRGGRVHIQTRVEHGSVRFQISDTGSPLIEAARRSLGVNEREVTLDSGEVGQYAAIRNFVRNCHGSLMIVPPEPPFVTSIVVTFPAAEVRTQVRAVTGLWALLVDDNPQVTNFYARVADALSLPYSTAASVEEAEALLRQRGRPRIVITDIQLGEGSGLELVRLLRREYDAAIPVIVVSGQTSDTLGNEVEKVGANKFLVKPVGRARLFTEIRELLDL